MKKQNKKTFAQRARDIEKKYTRAKFDPIEARDMEQELEALMQEQEAYRASIGETDNQMTFATGGSDDENPRGVSDPYFVGGVDIGPYATNPDHEAKVAKYYDEFKKLLDNTVSRPSALAKAIDDYIAQYVGGNTGQSPLKGTGKAIVDASIKNRIDPALLLAMMKTDSSLGQYLRSENNPANWGNDDDPTTPDVNFATIEDGINALAGQLAGYRDGTSRYGQPSAEGEGVWNPPMDTTPGIPAADSSGVTPALTPQVQQTGVQAPHISDAELRKSLAPYEKTKDTDYKDWNLLGRGANWLRNQWMEHKPGFMNSTVGSLLDFPQATLDYLTDNVTFGTMPDGTPIIGGMAVAPGRKGNFGAMTRKGVREIPLEVERMAETFTPTGLSSKVTSRPSYARGFLNKPTMTEQYLARQEQLAKEMPGRMSGTYTVPTPENAVGKVPVGGSKKINLMAEKSKAIWRMRHADNKRKMMAALDDIARQGLEPPTPGKARVTGTLEKTLEDLWGPLDFPTPKFPGGNPLNNLAMWGMWGKGMGLHGGRNTPYTGIGNIGSPGDAGVNGSPTGGSNDPTLQSGVSNWGSDYRPPYDLWKGSTPNLPRPEVVPPAMGSRAGTLDTKTLAPMKTLSDQEKLDLMNQSHVNTGLHGFWEKNKRYAPYAISALSSLAGNLAMMGMNRHKFKAPRVYATPQLMNLYPEANQLMQNAAASKNINMLNARNLGQGYSGMGAINAGIDRGLGNSLTNLYGTQGRYNTQITNQMGMQNAQRAYQSGLMNNAYNQQRLQDQMGYVGSMFDVLPGVMKDYRQYQADNEMRNVMNNYYNNMGYNYEPLASLFGPDAFKTGVRTTRCHGGRVKCHGGFIKRK